MATVLEEMPSFAERESSILSSILQKKKPPSELGTKLEREEKTEKQAEFSKNYTNGNSESFTVRTFNNISNDQIQQQIPTNQSIDLLGLNLSSPTVTELSKPTESNQDALFDIFGGPTPTISEQQQPVFTNSVQNNQLDSLFSNTFETNDVKNSQNKSTLSNDSIFTPISLDIDNHVRFIFKNNDVLFENESLQISFKSEYKQNLGRLNITFTNKTQSVFQNFMIQSNPCENDSLLRIILKPIENSIIQPMEELIQQINVECVNDFSHLPELTCLFSCNSIQSKFKIRLPVLISKFFEPTSMDSQAFFTRWKNLSKWVSFYFFLLIYFIRS